MLSLKKQLEILRRQLQLIKTVMVESMAALYPQVPIEVEAHVCANWGEK
jgi:hypothetical protein